MYICMVIIISVYSRHTKSQNIEQDRLGVGGVGRFKDFQTILSQPGTVQFGLKTGGFGYPSTSN